MSAPILRRVFGSLMVALCLALSAQAAERPWLQVKAREYTLVTDLSEKEAVAWAAEFSQFIAALQSFINVDPHRLPRLTIVVFARQRDFAGYRPLDGAGKPKEVVGFFSRRESWAVAGLAGAMMTPENRRTILHEGTHWFLSGFEGLKPVWLEEGLAEVFSTFSQDKKTMSWGRAIGEHVQALNVLEPMTLERLLYLSRSDLFRGGEEGTVYTGMAYAKSWAFVHYLIFGERDVSSTALIDYIRERGTGIHPDDAFQKAFGRTYVEMDRKLSEYLRYGRYLTWSKPIVPVTGLKAESASTLDVEDALARLCLAGHRPKEALEHARKAVTAAGDGPRGFELLGQVYLEGRDREKALEAFEKAVALGSRDFRPHYEIARSQSFNADGSRRQLNAEDARRIANGYERAINFNPQFQPAYQSLAGLVELLPGDASNDAPFLIQGLRLFPDDGMIRLAVAILARKEGDTATATKLLQEVLSDPSPSLQVRSHAQRLEATWRQGDVGARVTALEKEKKYDEALGLARAALAESGDPGSRRRFQVMIGRLEQAKRSEAVRVATAAGNWTEVRRIIQEGLDSDASPLIKTQLGNQLKDLDRRGLGKP